MAVIGLGVGFFFILLISIVFNALFLITFFRRQRLKQTGHYTLLLSLAFVDVIAGGIWTGVSAAGAALDWEPEVGLCRAQSYFFTLTQTLTAFTLASLSLERLLVMLKPSQHRMIFVPKVTSFLIFALVIFCGVVSSIHLYGTLKINWHGTEKQCRADFTESVKLLNMTFCFDYAIPYWVIALPALVGAWVKFFISRRSPSAYGEIVLEKNPYAPGDSYSSRLAKIQSKFGGGNNEKKRKQNRKLPTLGKRTYSSQGYSEMEHWDSDIDDGYGPTGTDDTKLRIHALPKPEFKMLLTSTVVIIVTAALWFPWIVVRFILTNTPRDPASDWSVVLSIVLIHSSIFVKPVLYFACNPYFRSAFMKTFNCCCRRSQSKTEKPKVEINDSDTLSSSGV